MNSGVVSLATVIKKNLAAVQDRMAAAAERAGRDPAAVTLVAITKYVDLDAVRALRDLGVIHFGESRVENAAPKIDAMAGQGAIWHMIGNIQRRKTKDALRLFDRIDALDRLSLAESIEARCAELDTHATVLVEVNVSGEAQKHGFTPAEVPEALEAIAALDRIQVRGLMTMAPLDAPPAQVRAVFAQLAALAAVHGLADISMGMSNDFELAIEAGATEVRVGSALFE